MAELLMLNHVAALFLSGVAAFYSFLYLNFCTYRTWIVMRFSLIMTFTASVGVIAHMLAGNNPHWLFTVIMFSLALQMYGDRRKPGV